MFDEKIFADAALQIYIERFPSQDISTLQTTIENISSIKTTHEERLNSIISNSSSELVGYIEEFKEMKTISEMKSLNNLVQSSNTLSSKEKQSFFVLSSTGENSFVFWKSKPKFSDINTLYIDVPNYVLVDAAAAIQYWNEAGQYEGVWGPPNTALYSARASANAKESLIGM